jgi:hypothetical protein
VRPVVLRRHRQHLQPATLRVRRRHARSAPAQSGAQGGALAVGKEIERAWRYERVVAAAFCVTSTTGAVEAAIAAQQAAEGRGFGMAGGTTQNRSRSAALSRLAACVGAGALHGAAAAAARRARRGARLRLAGGCCRRVLRCAGAARRPRARRALAGRAGPGAHRVRQPGAYPTRAAVREMH